MKPRLRMYTLDSVDSLCRKSAFRDREPRDCESSESHLVKCDILKDSCFFRHSSLEPVVAVPKVSAIVLLGVTRLGGLNLNARSQVKTVAALAELPACQTPPTLWLSRHKEAERIERHGIEGSMSMSNSAGLFIHHFFVVWPSGPSFWDSHAAGAPAQF